MDRINEVMEIIAKQLPVEGPNFEVMTDEQIYKVAGHIVEPLIYDDDALIELYGDYIENSTGEWSTLIKQCFGEFWGKIAEYIEENGY